MDRVKPPAVRPRLPKLDSEEREVMVEDFVQVELTLLSSSSSALSKLQAIEGKASSDVWVNSSDMSKEKDALGESTADRFTRLLLPRKFSRASVAGEVVVDREDMLVWLLVSVLVRWCIKKLRVSC